MRDRERETRKMKTSLVAALLAAVLNIDYSQGKKKMIHVSIINLYVLLLYFKKHPK